MHLTQCTYCVAVPNFRILFDGPTSIGTQMDSNLLFDEEKHIICAILDRRNDEIETDSVEIMCDKCKSLVNE